MSRRARLVRDPDADHVSVDFVELFFDLVYVFAVTQVSHVILARHDPVGLIEALVLFLAVWWAWTFTTWVTNWLDPRRVPVRLMVFAIMLASLVMAAALPSAFTDHGLAFALAYVAIQLGRSLFAGWAVRPARPALSLALARVALWFAASAPLWVAGALAGPPERLWLWSAAIAIEYLGPLVHFVAPVLGRSDTRDYAISGAHMAERCALLIIIALGESILITGTTFAASDWHRDHVAAALTAFAGAVALWWVYFDVGMKRGADCIEVADDSGRIARNAYTYAHLPIVAGIIVAAVADEMLLEHALAPVDAVYGWAMLGGPALFLAGTMIFKRLVGGSRFWPLSHLAGLILFGATTAWALLASPTRLGLAAASLAVLVVVAIWEWGSFHGGWIGRGPRRTTAGRVAGQHKDVATPPDKG